MAGAGLASAEIALPGRVVKFDFASVFDGPPVTAAPSGQQRIFERYFPHAPTTRPCYEKSTEELRSHCKEMARCNKLHLSLVNIF